MAIDSESKKSNSRDCEHAENPRLFRPRMVVRIKSVVEIGL
jgi:hypothetical protein